MVVFAFCKPADALVYTSLLLGGTSVLDSMMFHLSLGSRVGVIQLHTVSIMTELLLTVRTELILLAQNQQQAVV